MRKGASRIAVGAFSRGRWYPNTLPGETGILFVARGELQVSLATQEAECAIFVRHKCAIFICR